MVLGVEVGVNRATKSWYTPPVMVVALYGMHYKHSLDNGPRRRIDG